MDRQRTPRRSHVLSPFGTADLHTGKRLKRSVGREFASLQFGRQRDFAFVVIRIVAVGIGLLVIRFDRTIEARRPGPSIVSPGYG